MRMSMLKVFPLTAALRDSISTQCMPRAITRTG
jgi:hypothetical protein